MKKYLALFLVLAMLVSCLAACGDSKPDESSEDDSSAVTSEDSSSPDNPPEPVEIEYETIVSIGKPYKLTPAASADKYPDTFGTELCDGQYATEPTYSDEKYCGLAVGSSSARVEFDLGDDYKQLYKFGVSYLSSRTAGVTPISTTRIYYSMDKEKWSRSDFFIRPEEQSTSTMEIAWLTLDIPIDARYIRFDIRGNGGWLFLDEVIIIANTPGNAANAKYLESLNAAYTSHKVVENALKKGTEEIDRENLSPISATQGMRYKTSYQAADSLPDSSESPLLTDGALTGAGYENGGFVGFAGGKQLTIDVSLPKSTSGLADFELAMYQQKNLSYMLPYYVDVYVSADGAIYDLIGRSYAPDDLDITNFTFSVHLEKGVTAKAIRFVLAETDSKLYLIEELTASYYGVDGTRPLYERVELPKVTEDLYWPSSSANYSKNTNLVLGLPYQIESGTKLAYNDEAARNTPASAGVLTDGKYSPSSVYNNGYWNMTHNGTSRSIFFDLGYNSALTGFKINYLNQRDLGISVPSYASMYVSADGSNWYAAGSAGANAGNTPGPVAATLTLDKPIEARFVKIVFPVSPHTYVDEIEVYGTKKIPSGTRKASECGSVSVMNQFMAPSEDVLGGVSDLMLIYYTISTMKFDEDYFLPYVAYLTANESDPEKYDIKDTMFDGFLFLPSVNALPSGGMPYDAGSNVNYWSDWTFLYEECFKEGVNFDALDKTCAKVKKELGLADDYKLKVFVTIPYVNSNATKFGDVDGDGVSEDLSNLDDIRKVISTYVDMYETRFAEQNYENISLKGYYWFAESISSDVDPINLPEITKVIESKGSQLFWIPYYCAKGYTTWNSYGFVTACMQPNYVFKLQRPLSQLQQAAEIIRQYGMGIEIEINSNALHDARYFKRFMEYLGHGTIHGYMTDCIHMYYQDGATYQKACYSSQPMARKVYDSAYRFIKGTIAPPDAFDDFEVECQKDGVLNGKLFENKDNMLNAIMISGTEHGSLSIAPNGSYVYVPYEGFTGTDTFSFVCTDFLGTSGVTTVTVNVK